MLRSTFVMLCAVLSYVEWAARGAGFPETFA